MARHINRQVGSTAITGIGIIATLIGVFYNTWSPIIIYKISPNETSAVFTSSPYGIFGFSNLLLKSDDSVMQVDDVGGDNLGVGSQVSICKDRIVNQTVLVRILEYQLPVPENSTLPPTTQPLLTNNTLPPDTTEPLVTTPIPPVIPRLQKRDINGSNITSSTPVLANQTTVPLNQTTVPLNQTEFTIVVKVAWVLDPEASIWRILALPFGGILIILGFSLFYMSAIEPKKNSKCCSSLGRLLGLAGCGKKMKNWWYRKSCCGSNSETLEEYEI